MWSIQNFFRNEGMANNRNNSYLVEVLKHRGLNRVPVTLFKSDNLPNFIVQKRLFHFTTVHGTGSLETMRDVSRGIP